MSERCKRRIHVADVVAAYEDTGYDPVRYETIMPMRNLCCGLAAMAVAEDDSIENGMDVLDWARRHCGSEYTEGFMVGFDCYGLPSEKSYQFRMGYSDGKAAADVVFAANA